MKAEHDLSLKVIFASHMNCDFLNQQKCLNDLNAKKVKHPKMWTKEFIDENQKLFTLCTQCHSDLEHLSKEKFFEKYKREKKKYIFCED